MTSITVPHLSVITPVYGCAEALPELCQRLHKVLAELSPAYEIIMVNDASPDDAWAVIQGLAHADERVKGINLSRNFGQHYAISAGLDFAQGDWVIVMDCDLQDLPEEIPGLYSTAQLGYDVVVGRRAIRQDGWLKKFLSKQFARVFSYFTGARLDNRIGNFGIYAQKVIRSIRPLREQNRSFGLFVLWVGFRRIEIDVKHAPRTYGKTSYNFRKMMALAMDSILAHSDKLLRLTVKLGLIISLLSLCFAVWIIARYFLWSAPLLGWTSLIVSVYFSTGLIVGAIGVLGLYVGKIFNEVKNRPLYVIDMTTFDHDVFAPMYGYYVNLDQNPRGVGA